MKANRSGFWLCIIYVCSEIIHCEEQLRYAAVLYRHGDRTPVDPYPTDPWKNESFWPVRFGQLTNMGKKQQYAFGKWLRARYNNLISEKFDPTEACIRSTDVDRTLMSAMANLAGMYPPVKESIWNPQLNWQPIPVHSEPEQEDELLSMKKKCPNFDLEKERVKKSSEYKRRLEKYETLLELLTERAGFEVKDYEDIGSIYSVLKIEKLYNFTLPNWTNEVFPDKMAEPAAYSFTTDTSTPLMARLKVGPFLKQVVQNMLKTMHHHNSKIEYHDVKYTDLDGVPPLKMNMYSAHDLNIGSVLNALGLYDYKCPEYTSSILFELVFDNSIGIHFVKIFYRNSTDIMEPAQLTIPGCGDRCPLEKFVTLYDAIIPYDWDDECTQKFPLKFALTCFFGLMLYILSSLWYYYPYFGKRLSTTSHNTTVRSELVAVKIEPNTTDTN